MWAAQQTARACSAAGDTNATRQRQQQLGTQAQRRGQQSSSEVARPARRDKAWHEVTANLNPT
jgi:hypothetical protein